ncbi:3'-5' exonuclease [Halosquirtibacter xylanolyticus]|uniref:3'-5' exonuclease n=1 Tax=Halosquirtibacter xylanolyticus TaxID=3374599 RepID=UPI00374A0B25|nr:3'-5' exonuclease [Prolixibacteraceae bacterium]
MDSFVALDFETANRKRESACSLAIVTVEKGKILETFHTFIRPPDNDYDIQNIQVHGITPEITEYANDFRVCFPEIYKRIKGKTIVAHNESFDRGVLRKAIEYYHIDASELDLTQKWHCTYRLWKKVGLEPTTLKHCCEHFGIQLNHHDAISDAEASAKLFVIYQYYLNQTKK